MSADEVEVERMAGELALADQHDRLTLLTRYMADHGYTPEEIAYAVEKPKKHADVMAQAIRERDSAP